jgi:TonB family protein
MDGVMPGRSNRNSSAFTSRLRRLLAWLWGDWRRGLGLANGLRLSVAAHVILLLVLAWLPASSRPARWENRPLVVSLVGRPGGGGGGGGPASLRAPARAEPAASPAKPKLPELKHKDETPPEKPKEKPKAKPKAEPKEKPAAQLPEVSKAKTEAPVTRVPATAAPDDHAPSGVNAAAAQASAAAPAVGAGGGTGSGTGAGAGSGGPLQVSAGIDEPGFGYDYYLQALIGKISETWRPPAGLPSEALGTVATLRFHLSSEGRVQQVDVETASPFPIFDRSALDAIMRAQPFPPFPPGYGGRSLTVHMKFTFRE